MVEKTFPTETLIFIIHGSSAVLSSLIFGLLLEKMVNFCSFLKKISRKYRLTI